VSQIAKKGLTITIYQPAVSPGRHVGATECNIFADQILETAQFGHFIIFSYYWGSVPAPAHCFRAGVVTRYAHRIIQDCPFAHFDGGVHGWNR
jgi:hypothetical protein